MKKIHIFIGVMTLLICELKIEQLISIEEHINELSELLMQVVDDGASIGFLPPLSFSDAKTY